MTGKEKRHTQQRRVNLLDLGHLGGLEGTITLGEIGPDALLDTSSQGGESGGLCGWKRKVSLKI